MKKTYIYILFTIMVIAQIFASAQVVYKYETTIAAGNIYKFKTAPVDPNDPFRGKYITLNFQLTSFNTNDDSWKLYDEGYLYISKDALGFAVIETLSKTKISNHPFDYIKVEINGYYNGAVHYRLPFERYYMEETKAYDAELLYRNNQQTETSQEIYAIIHIQNETPVLTDVVVNGISIKDAVEK
jgi:uncharacterized membrane-anchored protein